VKSAFTICCEIYTEAKKMASELQDRQVTLRVNPEVGKALKARDNTILSEVEEMIGKPVLVRNDPNLHIETFAFE
jgi:ribonuclease G